MGPVGMPEMFLIFILALLLFGPKKLPELGRMLGKGLSEFRRAKNELKSTFETHMRELERETRLDSDSKSGSSTPDYSSKSYSYPYDEYGQYSSNNYGSESHDESYKPYEPTPNEPVHTTSSPGSENGTEKAHLEVAHPAPEQTPVTGTVPRSNGVQPIEPVSVSAEEEHRG
jgi:sec-independent protein translocase protein TatA